MKALMILLTGLSLVGCETNHVQLPDWELAARVPTPVTDPTPLPDICIPPFESLECYEALDAYDIVAMGNTEIAQTNADALRKTEAGYDALIEAGKLQQQLSQIRQEILEEERKAHMHDKWFYQGIIVLGLLAAAL